MYVKEAIVYAVASFFLEILGQFVRISFLLDCFTWSLQLENKKNTINIINILTLKYVYDRLSFVWKIKIVFSCKCMTTQITEAA